VDFQDIVHVDGDDWHWFFVNGELATEGHTPPGVIEEVLDKVLGPDGYSYGYIYVEDYDLAQEACHAVDTLEEFFDLGLDGSEIE
jgi:hypothetical protein